MPKTCSPGTICVLARHYQGPRPARHESTRTATYFAAGTLYLLERIGLRGALVNRHLRAGRVLSHNLISNTKGRQSQCACASTALPLGDLTSKQACNAVEPSIPFISFGQLKKKMVAREKRLTGIKYSRHSIVWQAISISALRFKTSPVARINRGSFAPGRSSARTLIRQPEPYRIERSRMRDSHQLQLATGSLESDHVCLVS